MINKAKKMVFIIQSVSIVAGYQPLRPENLLPIIQLLLLVVATPHWLQALILFTLIQGTASYFFGAIGNHRHFHKQIS